MQAFDNSSVIPQQHWSWRVCALLAAIAVTIDVLILQSPLVWLAVAGAFAILAQFRSPLSGLAVVIFSCGLLNYSPFEMGALSRLYPGDVAIVIFLLAWLMSKTSKTSWSSKNLFPPTGLNRPLLGIAVVALVSMVWSRLHPDLEVTYAYPHSDVSWGMAQLSQVALLAITVCLPFAVAAGIKRRKDIETVIMLIGMVVSIGALLTAGGLIFGYGSSFEILGARRAYWDQSWASSMEPLTALCFPFLYAGVLFGRRALVRYRIVCVLCALCLLGVVLTFSRESWLLTLCAIFMISAAWLRSRVNPAWTIVIVVVVIAVLSSGIIGSASHFYNPNDVYGFERIYYYATALQLFAAHPLLGVGAGNYQFFDRLYEGESAGGIAHNQFLTAAAETGLAGLLMLGWFVLVLLKLRKQLRSHAGPLGDWIKVGGSAFLLIWIGECFFQEAFFPTASAGGGMQVLTATVYPWIFLGVLLASFRINDSAAGMDN